MLNLNHIWESMDQTNIELEIIDLTKKIQILYLFGNGLKNLNFPNLAGGLAQCIPYSVSWAPYPIQ